MSAPTPRLVASAALFALLPGACSDATGPEAEPTTVTAAAADVYSYGAVLEGVIPVPPGDEITACLAEPIEVHFRGRFRVMLQQTGSGERSLSGVHMNDMGSWALGNATGTEYRLVGSSIDQTTDGANGYGNGASTWTSSGRQQYVGPSGTAFTVRSSYGLTITPEGALAVERLSSIIECR